VLKLVETSRNIACVGLVYVLLLLGLVIFVRPLTLPDESSGMAVSAGSTNAVLQQISGKRTPTDFLVEYASARALLDGEDPYVDSYILIDRAGGPSWPVAHANPHPPTMVALALPFSLSTYQNALAAWSVLMIFALIWTIHFSGVALRYAIPVGLAVAFTFPGAYGIGNVVPVIGFGIALAYRFRHNPALAAVGITLAAIPKTSGLLLVIPFLLTQRWRTMAWTIGLIATAAAIPLMFFSGTWSSYMERAPHAIRVNADRDDNASLLYLAEDVGISRMIAGAIIVLVAATIAWRIRDTFWPTVWMSVAALPIMWMYSLLTLLPLFCVSLRRQTATAIGAVILATTLIVGTIPGGQWPVRVVPIVIILSLIALTQVRETSFWPSRARWAQSFARLTGHSSRPGELPLEQDGFV